MFNSNKIKRLEGERDDYAKRWIEANDRATRADVTIAGLQQGMQQMRINYDRLNRRFADTERLLRSAREANSRYFYELSKMKPRPQLVVLDAGCYADAFGIERHAWSVWLDGVRLYTTSIRADNAEQPERLWLTVEALERALGVKAMRARVRNGFDAEAAGGGPRKLTPSWMPLPPWGG